jgi:biofilm PGA synthesis N-glycosyltransferase PgaC
VDLVPVLGRCRHHLVVERVVTVWYGGWRARLLAATLFPELGFAMFLNFVYVKGILDIAVRRQAGWKHVVQSGTAQIGERG